MDQPPEFCFRSADSRLPGWRSWQNTHQGEPALLDRPSQLPYKPRSRPVPYPDISPFSPEVDLGGRPLAKPLVRPRAEDLIIHRCVAGRARDVEDVERILVRQRLALDLRYIRKWLRAFESVVEGHDVRAVFENILKRARAAV